MDFVPNTENQKKDTTVKKQVAQPKKDNLKIIFENLQVSYKFNFYAIHIGRI